VLTIPLSVLDLARHAERLGYTRHRVAEHHNMQGIASAATAVAVERAVRSSSFHRFAAHAR